MAGPRQIPFARGASYMRTFRALILAACLAVIMTCGETDRPEDATDEMVGIEMAPSQYLSNGPLFIDLEERYFAEEGIDLHLHPSSEAGSTSIPSLDRGQIAA